MKKELTLIISLVLPVLAYADDTSQPTAQGAMGGDTRALMELQRSGSAASTTERPMSGDVAKRTNQRYVNSFSIPIPKSLSAEEESFVKDDKK